MAVPVPQQRPSGFRDACNQAGYPRFTALGDTSILNKLPDDGQFNQGSPAVNTPNGPFYPSAIDLDAIRKADGTLAIPRASRSYRYAMLLGPDHSSGVGGQWLYTANNPRRWTLESETAKVTSSIATGSQLEAITSILWNPWLEEFVAFPHVSTTGQPTLRMTSSDLESWATDDVIGSEPYVIRGAGGHYGYGKFYFQDGQLFCNHRINGSAGFIWGQSVAVDHEWKHWRPTGNVSFGLPQPFATDAIGADWQYMNVPQPFRLGGRWWQIATMRETYGARSDDIYLCPLENDLWTPAGPWRPIIERGGASSTSEVAAHTPTLLYTADALWMYYVGQDASHVGHLLAARCGIAKDGSYDAQ